jgi:putative ABC transport system substrate-binding protein
MAACGARAAAGNPVVGFLDPTSADAEADRLRAFRQGLKDAGFVEGENVEIVYRFAENQSDRLSALAAELVRRQVAVIATRSLGARAAKTVNLDDPHRFHALRRPGQAGSCRKPRPAGRQCNGDQFFQY